MDRPRWRGSCHDAWALDPARAFAKSAGGAIRPSELSEATREKMLRTRDENMARTENQNHVGPRAEDVAVKGRDPLSPRAQGLYDPAKEHDSCGVGFVANLHNAASHDIVEMGLQILLNLDHRGAVGADPKLGDGCGILVQIPHEFFAQEAEKLGIALPKPGEYAIGQFFLPRDAETRAKAVAVVEAALKAEGLTVLGWRDLPVDSSDLGDAVRAVEPFHAQVFVGRGADVKDEADFERRLYLARKTSSNEIYALGALGREHYSVSLSTRTIVYKGMVLVQQLGKYFLDLQDARFVSALALVHQRFATNTFPSWRLAHPYRFVAHNGEINTLRGNLNWMAARQATVASPLFGDDIGKIWPISYEGQSDTACFDNALEFLVRGGYSLAHAVMMLIPEAWSGNPLMDAHRKAFYEYHAALMEPWDGPAAMAFTDGRQIGATLDRNGLRPARYLVTDDGLVVMASEMGVLPIPQEKIISKWRLQPGKMLLVDLEKGRIVSDDEIKTSADLLASLSRMAGAHANRARGFEAGRAARLARRRVPARPPAGLRLHARGSGSARLADGRHRPGGGGLDGHGHADLAALRSREPALHLFQTELRAGDQSADRPDPRGVGHEPRVLHRPAPQYSRP